MKIDTGAQRNVEGFSPNRVEEFKINAGPALLAVLTNLYVDPIRATVREPACNAWDAHVTAGNTEQPFEITCPSLYDPYYSIRDFGTGLSEQDVYDLFSTFGGSTKQGDNDTIGGFGIGSKSFFAATESAIITSIFGGRAMVFSAYKNEQNLPVITKLSDEPTNEQNGIEIKFPVEGDKHAAYAKAIVDTVRHFEPMPVVKNLPNDMSITPLKYVMTGKNWGVTDDFNRPKVLMGNVMYDVDSNVLGVEGEARSLLTTGLVMKFDIGEVKPTPSRESLEYTDKTKSVLKTRLEDILVELKANVAERFKNVKNEGEAYIVYKGLFNTFRDPDLYSYQRTTMQKFIEQFAEYDGSRLEDYRWGDGTTVTDCAFATVSSFDQTERKHLSPSWSRFITYRPEVSNDEFSTKVFIIDEPRSYIAKTRAELDRLNNPDAIFVKAIEPDVDVSKVVDKWGVTPILVSTLPEPPKKASSSTSSGPGRNFAPFYTPKDGWKDSRYWRESSYDTIQRDIDKGGVYVRLYRWAPANDTGSPISYMKTKIKMVEEVTGEKLDVVLVSSQHFKKIEKRENWINFSTLWFKHKAAWAKKNAHLEDEAFGHRELIKIMHSNSAGRALNGMFELMEKGLLRDPRDKSPLVKFYNKHYKTLKVEREEVSEYFNRLRLVDPSANSSIYTGHSNPTPRGKVAKAVRKDFNALLERYKLLDGMVRHTNEKGLVDHYKLVMSYMHLVDSNPAIMAKYK